MIQVSLNEVDKNIFFRRQLLAVRQLLLGNIQGETVGTASGQNNTVLTGTATKFQTVHTGNIFGEQVQFFIAGEEGGKVKILGGDAGCPLIVPGEFVPVTLLWICFYFPAPFLGCSHEKFS